MPGLRNTFFGVMVAGLLALPTVASADDALATAVSALENRWVEIRYRNLDKAQKLEGGRDLAFVIGGPDGLSVRLKSEAGTSMRLSNLTLPHGLARVLLAEQLYRAVSIMQNHPYHRE